MARQSLTGLDGSEDEHFRRRLGRDLASRGGDHIHASAAASAFLICYIPKQSGLLHIFRTKFLRGNLGNQMNGHQKRPTKGSGDKNRGDKIKPTLRSARPQPFHAAAQFGHALAP